MAVKIIAFDVFGTVVDWYGSIVQQITQAIPEADANAITLAWRDGYAPALKAVNASNEWVLLDELHRRMLDTVLDEFELNAVSEETRQSLTKAWHQLNAWPDSVEGIQRLKTGYTVCSLSNGNLGLLTNMAKNAGIPWDCVLSAEVFKRYKPDPATYLGVAKIFDVAPEEVMLAAAHQDDLDAARACGLQTAYIERPEEFGPIKKKSLSVHGDNHWHAKDIIDLAKQFGC